MDSELAARRGGRGDCVNSQGPCPPQRTGESCLSFWNTPHKPRTPQFCACSSQTHSITSGRPWDTPKLSRYFPGLPLRRGVPAVHRLPVSSKATESTQSKQPFVEQLLCIWHMEKPNNEPGGNHSSEALIVFLTDF